MLNPKAILSNQKFQEPQTTSFVGTHFPTFTRLVQSVALQNRLERLSIKAALRTLVAAVLLTVFGANQAGAWTWVLHHQGFAPNSNANWTNLRVGVYSYDKNDPDQQISFVENNGGHMLVNLSNTLNPKLCYTASSTNLLAELVLRTCDRANPMQQFKVHNAGNVAPDVMNVMIQLKDTNLCFANSEQYNYGRLVVDNCRWGQNHADQFFYMEKVNNYIHQIGAAPQPRTYKVRATKVEQGARLIRTGGSHILGKQWGDIENPFFVTQNEYQWGNGPEGQRKGNRECTIIFQNTAPNMVSVNKAKDVSVYFNEEGELVLAGSIGLNANVEAEVDANSLGIGGITGGGSGGGNFATSAEKKSLDQVSRTVSSNDNIEFQYLLALDRKTPLVNVGHIWYHMSLGVCVANIWP